MHKPFGTAYYYVCLLLVVLPWLCWTKDHDLNAVPNEDWGYVVVDKNHDANMFWWMYGAQVSNRTSTPLILWLQGGPGASSWLGDLLEFGPRDVFLQPRKYTWLNLANLLFIDNPVGTGFSYVGRGDGYVRTERQVAEELYRLLKVFFTEKYPIFIQHQTPFWIWAESYGPKYAVHLARLLDEEIGKGNLHLNFKGVGLGDGWLAPMTCVKMYASFMRSVSLVNDQQMKEIEAVAEEAQYLYDHGEQHKAGNYVDNYVQGPFLEQFWPNILNFLELPPNHLFAQFDKLMVPNGAIRQKLKIIPANVTFGGQSQNVSNDLAVDFLHSAVNEVDYLLDKGYRVVVYSGQLDIVVLTPCTERWIQTLRWAGLRGFNISPREKVTSSVDGRPLAFVQSFENFSFYNILRAGHMVPMDNPEAAYVMVNSVLHPQ